MPRQSEKESRKKVSFSGLETMGNCCCGRFQLPTQTQPYYNGCVSLRHRRKFIDNKRRQRKKCLKPSRVNLSSSDVDDDNYLMELSCSHSSNLSVFQFETKLMRKIFMFVFHSCRLVVQDAVCGRPRNYYESSFVGFIFISLAAY